jgi:hypothetical protein
MGGELMMEKDISEAKDQDLVASLEAIQKAAQLARKIAIQTDTAIVVMRDQKIEKISAQQLREEIL